MNDVVRIGAPISPEIRRIFGLSHRLEDADTFAKDLQRRAARVQENTEAIAAELFGCLEIIVEMKRELTQKPLF